MERIEANTLNMFLAEKDMLTKRRELQACADVVARELAQAFIAREALEATMGDLAASRERNDPFRIKVDEAKFKIHTQAFWRQMLSLAIVMQNAASWAVGKHALVIDQVGTGLSQEEIMDVLRSMGIGGF